MSAHSLMLVIADTSALIALATCDGLSLLDSLFTRVQVPRAVYEEATLPGKSQADHLKTYLQGKVVDIDLHDFVIATNGLGKGELEAMAMYKKQLAGRLLIDDLRARKVALYNDIQVIGSVGILLLAKKKNLIPSIKPYLQILQKSDIHLGTEFINKAILMAGEQ